MADEKKQGKLTRRDFLKSAATSAAIIGAVGAAGCGKSEQAMSQQVSADKARAMVPRKMLGKTGMNVSILALGGGSALTMEKDDQKALELIDLARRRGINYFDSGSEYGGGQSELRIGEALEPYRKDIFLSTKFSPGIGPDKLMKHFERSLKRLRTDYVDNVNMHGLTKDEDAELMFSTGTLETVVKLKEQGLVKHIGASAHHPGPLMEGMKRFRFDSVMAATNATGYHFVSEFDKIVGSFENTVLPLAKEQGIGCWAFKVTGQRLLIALQEGEPHKADGLELIRYGFSLPVHGVILGMTTPEHVNTACDLAINLKPMTPAEMKQMNEKLAPSADKLTYLDPNYVDDGGWRAHLA